MRSRRSGASRWSARLARTRARAIEWLHARVPGLHRALDRVSTLPVFLAILALVAAGTLLVALRVGSHAGRSGPAPVPSGSRTPAEGIAAGATREVLLFFQRSDRLWLGTETGEIFSALTDTEQAKQILELLLRGPGAKGGLRPTIPLETRLREIYLGPDGTAYADFSRDLAERHPGGTHAEIATIYSIVDSLAYNIPRIRRVQLLLDGHEVQTLTGHILLTRPIPPDYGFVDRTPAREPEKATGKGGST